MGATKNRLTTQQTYRLRRSFFYDAENNGNSTSRSRPCQKQELLDSIGDNLSEFCPDSEQGHTAYMTANEVERYRDHQNQFKSVKDECDSITVAAKRQGRLNRKMY